MSLNNSLNERGRGLEYFFLKKKTSKALLCTPKTQLNFFKIKNQIKESRFLS